MRLTPRVIAERYVTATFHRSANTDQERPVYPLAVLWSARPCGASRLRPTIQRHFVLDEKVNELLSVCWLCSGWLMLGGRLFNDWLMMALMTALMAT